MLRKLGKPLMYQFRTMTPSDYLHNQRESQLTRTPHQKTLTPLDNANQGNLFVSDEVQLIGVPKGQSRDVIPEMDIFKKMLLQGERDLIFLQIDPSAYIARERFMSHRCAMGKVQDYRLDGVHLIDPHKPFTWQQTVVNLLTMDMLDKNALPNELNYKNGMYAYSYPYIQQKKQSTAITQNFITQISEQILDGQRTGYDMIEKVLYTSLMGRHKIMLGGMPQTQYRMILGKSLSVEEMRDVFRLVVMKNKELTVPWTIKDASQNFLPHIFLLPKDLYMTAILKQSFQAAIQMLCFVGIQHWRPMQQYWVGPPHGINYTQATHIPDGFPGETAQDLIEKQALLDVMLQTRVWSRNYLSNPFPYLFEDVTKVDQKQLESYKKLFIKYYRKYSQFKNRQVKLLQQKVQKLQLQNKKTEQVLEKDKPKSSSIFKNFIKSKSSDKQAQINKIRLQQVKKMKDSLGELPTLSYLKDKMVLDLDKKIKIKNKQ